VVNWTQQRTGNLGQIAWKDKFETWEDWTSNWPQKGADLGGGWIATDAYAYDTAGPAQSFSSSFSWTNRAKEHANGDTMSVSISSSATITKSTTTVTTSYESSGTSTFGDPSTGQAASTSISLSSSGIGCFDMNLMLALGYQMANGRKETISFTMAADMQPIVTYPEDEPPIPEQISLTGTDVGVAFNAGDAPPIGDVGNGTYFPTDRGLQSLQYALLFARAHLMLSMRAVKVNFECAFDRAIDLSCRKNALLHDDRLPGGQALGKITEYHLKGDGGTGQLVGAVQIESTIGNAGAVSVMPGDPTYVEAGYVSRGYQFYENSIIAVPSGDVTFTPPMDSLIGDLNPRAMIVHNEFHGWRDKVYTPPPTKDASTAVQPKPLVSINNPVPAPVPVEHNNFVAGVYVGANEIRASNAAEAIQQWLDSRPSWYFLELQPITGLVFDATYNVQVGPLVAPKMLDLAAESTRHA
jgi:hypothetical protein